MKAKTAEVNPNIWKDEDRILRVVADEHGFALAAVTVLDASIAEAAYQALPTKEKTRQHDLYAAQLKTIKRDYPKTARLLLKAHGSAAATDKATLHKEALATYIAEVFLRHGTLMRGYFATPADRKHIAAALRRKPRRFDRVDYELALHFYRKGYNRMKPEVLAQTIFEATGKLLSAGTVKRRRLRLGLVSDNDEGRPVRYNP
jgi:hypothetical protein